MYELPAKIAKGCSLLGQDFKFPISAKVKECVKKKISLDDNSRKQLIRESVTCLQANAGERITSKHFEEAAKQLCNEVPILMDEKPPLWPDEIEFQYWVSLK